jgi:hypothetical protein
LQSPYVYSVFHTTPFLEHHVQELFWIRKDSF